MVEERRSHLKRGGSSKYYMCCRFGISRCYSCACAFLGVFAKLRKAAVSFIMSVRPSAWNNSVSHWKNFRETLYFGSFLKICGGKICFVKIWQEKWVLYMKIDVHFLSYVTQFCLEWNNLQTKFYVENQNTHFRFSKFFLENKALCEIIWEKNLVQPEMPQMKIRHMRIACWVPKFTKTDTHST
jgi:hypothetical protein